MKNVQIVRRFGFFILLILLSTFVLPATDGSGCFAQVQRTTQCWGNSSTQFMIMGEQIAERHEINMLAMSDVQLWQNDKLVPVESSAIKLLTDGSVGKFGDEGRFWVEAMPAAFTFYLGRERTIHEINVFSGNVDERSNQRFEIRLANNAANPGQKPAFPEKATFDSGDKYLGANGGGVKTSFTNSGKPLDGNRYDWLEIRIWSSYKIAAGTPIQDVKSAAATCYVELELLGDPKSDGYFTNPENKNAWLRKLALAKLNERLKQLSSDAQRALNSMPALRRAVEDLAKDYPNQYPGAQNLARLAKFEQKLSLDDVVNMSDDAINQYLANVKDYLAFRREALLANPALKFDKVLVRTASHPGLVANWISSAARDKSSAGQNKLQILSLSDPNTELKPAVVPPRNCFIGDICLNWDADRLLVSSVAENGTFQIFEAQLSDPNLFRQITPDMGRDVDNVEGCYTPDGAVVFVSTASNMGVPCIAGLGAVGNLFRVDAPFAWETANTATTADTTNVTATATTNGSNESSAKTDAKTKVRQLTFEQDQDWNPTILPNGRVMYLRWEYTDLPHYFSRIVMSMNPDGTNQLEYYGSNSFWPNSNFYTKSIPGSGSKFVGIVTGHHGDAQREGELYIFDPKKGRHETSGVVQQIPGWNKPVAGKIMDQLCDESWPRFLFPAPINEKYILVTARMDRTDPWGLYLVDVFDNMLLIKESSDFGIFEPTPIVKRDCPPVISPRFDDQSKEATVFITDVYFGPGLKDVPRGTVKKLRLMSYQYGYRGIGGHHLFGVESSWDSKLVLGEVPVYEDGSAGFYIPANTPISIQPLDENGRALQLMRSWLVGMPGEQLSCTGCHESQNSVTPARLTKASRKIPDRIEPFNGPARPFGFVKEVQPILDKYCAGCHDGRNEDGIRKPNFADASYGERPADVEEKVQFAWQVGLDPKTSPWLPFSRSYMALMPYVRRPGPESDAHLLTPAEYHANTSYLFNLIKDGKHYNVKLDDVSMRTLYTWADFNCPFHATWTDVANTFYAGRRNEEIAEKAKRTQELRAQYANLDDYPETGAGNSVPVEPRPQFVKPQAWTRPDTSVQGNTQDSIAAESAAQPELGQVSAPLETKQFVLGQDEAGADIVLTMVKIPAGRFVIGDDSGAAAEVGRGAVEIANPFWLATTETTNQMYKLFNPAHDSRYIDAHGKDHSSPGYAANNPLQPVIRVNWNEANAFCKWLSEKTGQKFSLPTEAQWEYACRAGTAGPFWFAPDYSCAQLKQPDDSPDFAPFANLADRTLSHFTTDHFDYLPKIETVNDRQRISANVGMYKSNPWGLYDMIGNVSEWTRSPFVAYPYKDKDEDKDEAAGFGDGKKVVRGGSWYDRPAEARAGSRAAYPAWQKVYNVGFRVMCEP